jgi:hypothetical protein
MLLFCACKGGRRAAHTGPPVSDVEFAKEVLRLLVEGDEEVTDMIDWEHLILQGNVDAGAKYREAAKDDVADSFTKAFISSFSSSYKRGGGDADLYFNWREQSRDSSSTIVAADGRNGRVLLMTVTHVNGQQKVSAIDIK